jgi:hypothetical protein
MKAGEDKYVRRGMRTYYLLALLIYGDEPAKKVVERYQMHENYDLRGPAEDALRAWKSMVDIEKRK